MYISKNAERDAEILRALESGQKVKAVAAMYGLNPSRISQIKCGYKWIKGKAVRNAANATSSAPSANTMTNLNTETGSSSAP